MPRKALHILWYTIACFLLLVGDGHAFGPVTHITLGCKVLGSLGMLAPGLARLLEEHSHAFLYGNMAADVIIAKNLAAEDRHCHNWQVGFGVLEEAHTESEQAFAWGYLCHLAADVIAHNYFVPWKLVEGFPARSTGHAYWEIRLDQKAPADSWHLIDTISRQRFTEQHGLLARTIEGTLFRFETNLTIFNGMLFFQRLKRWRRLLDRVERRSKWSISNQEAEELYELAYKAMMELLTQRQQGEICLLDPTGIPNLHVAKQLRRSLRRQQRRGPNRARTPLTDEELRSILESIQLNFRAHVLAPFQTHIWPEDLGQPRLFLSHI